MEHILFKGALPRLQKWKKLTSDKLSLSYSSCIKSALSEQALPAPVAGYHCFLLQ